MSPAASITSRPGTAKDDAALELELGAGDSEDVAFSPLSVALAEPSRLVAVTPVLFTH